MIFKIEWGYTMHIMPNHICAWCKIELPRIPNLEPGKVSHGICPECYKKKIREMDTLDEIDRIFDPKRG